LLIFVRLALIAYEKPNSFSVYYYCFSEILLASFLGSRNNTIHIQTQTQHKRKPG
jgi:hypothetical protein